ncbi:XF1762 family protein [Streptomyces murinus]|uniref:XF1762 family protein n=1 Tax=Streptomyces murinus TaxID=33900 RepID=UPI003D66F00C
MAPPSKSPAPPATAHATPTPFCTGRRGGAAKALGYRRLVTYTQAGESGASLRGAGWRVIARRPPRTGWHTPSRPRAGRGNDRIARLLWEAP